MAEFVKIAETGEIPVGTAKAVEIRGNTIAVINIDGTYHAIDNACSHVGGPLAEGVIDGEEVTCPWHGARFNIPTGEVLGPPAGKGLTKYPVRVNNNDIEIEL